MKPIELGSFKIWPPVMSAPMAGYTDRVYREILRENGCPYCVTEMISAKGFLLSSDNSLELMKHGPDDEPLAVQLFGSDPDTLVEAAVKLQELPYKFEVVDVNMGCPARKIVSQGAGGALLKDLHRAAAMVRGLKETLSVPVTAKVRLGWDDPSSSLSIARVLAEAGVDMLVVHGRTVSQGFSGESQWDWISRMGQEVSIPVVGNGDVNSPSEASEKLQMKGISGVMIGRALLGNPFFFRELNLLFSDSQSPSSDGGLFQTHDRIALAIEHFRRAIDEYGEHRGLLEMRKHLSFYVKGLKGASKIRQAIVRENSPREVLKILEQALANN